MRYKTKRISITNKRLEEAFDIISSILFEKTEKFRIKYDEIYIRIDKDVKSIGVQGDERTYLPVTMIGVYRNGKVVYNKKFMREISSEISNKVKITNKVTYDV